MTPCPRPQVSLAVEMASATCLIFLFLGGPALAQQKGDPKQAAERSEHLFVRRIAPLLKEKCQGCHGNNPEEVEGSLDVRSLGAILAGGDSEEAAIVPGEPENSPLYLAATRASDAWSAMPPKEAERLTAEQLRWLRDWIRSGAAWPDASRRKAIEEANASQWSAEDGMPVRTSGGLDADWTNRKYDPAGLWAYQPLADVALEGEANPIDLWIQRATPEGLVPADRADRRTLIRRATLDLTGLPPTPAEVDAFLRDPRPDHTAFAEVVDRLLASPHYGERMAQHWLDVVRYADSSGFANDFERGNAWRYRDYVVRAFNEDKPYDQFIREQLAGDELDPSDPEKLIATGFLRMGPWELTGMEVPKIARQRFLDDVTNSVGETFLAHSLQCARCHDHKFDPVPTRDYYAIQAVFATTQLAERKADFLEAENTNGFSERSYLVKTSKEHQETLAELDRVLLANAERWFADHPQASEKHKSLWDKTVARFRNEGRRNAFGAARSTLRSKGVPETEYPPKLVGFTPEQFGRQRVANKGLQRLGWEFDRYRPFALAVYNGRTQSRPRVVAPTRIPGNRMTHGELEETAILTGGDPFSPSQRVSPGALSVVFDQAPVTIPDEIAGRRSKLAEWVADPRNPLTPRVIVNRLWLWHFGRAIAGNPNNFGSTGKRPTHPGLLDWLAATLIREGWSIKAMHRRIMLSEAYGRSSRHEDPARLHKLDPQGDRYAVFPPRRLTAEELRDAMLAATGELNPTLGGVPCRPEINLEAALQPRQVMGTFAAAWTPNPLPRQRHRRSLYVLRLRGLIDPMLEVFNSPAPDFSCEQRDASTVTPQVFSLFNSRNTHARALALAARALKAADNDREALRRCFQWTLCRNPTDAESQEFLKHWRDVEQALPTEAPPRAAPPLEVIREAVEENTGEKFTFVERLHANDDFVADLQPADVDRHTRALSDVGLVLLNCNEFVYVY